MAGRLQGIALSFLYWSLRRLLELVVLCFRSELLVSVVGLKSSSARSKTFVRRTDGRRDRAREAF